MTRFIARVASIASPCCSSLGAAAAAPCRATRRARRAPPQPDKFLFDRGTEALKDKKWLTAREFFSRSSTTTPQSPFRPDAKLGDRRHLSRRGTTEALVLAVNEFREFLTFYPTNPRADYAQYKLGMAHFRQMLAPQRDQTETRDAIKEFEMFVDALSQQHADARGARCKLREARDRLSEADYRVGFFYYPAALVSGRGRPLQGAVEAGSRSSPTRRGLLLPWRSHCSRSKREAEALPYYEMLVEEFEQSEYLADAHQAGRGAEGTGTSQTSGG